MISSSLFSDKTQNDTAVFTPPELIRVDYVIFVKRFFNHILHFFIWSILKAEPNLV